MPDDNSSAGQTVWTTYRPTLIAAAIAVPLFLAVFVFAGGGHWKKLPLLLLFPWGPLAAMAGGFSHLSALLSIGGALAQFPAYGLVLRAAARAGQFRLAAAILGLTHVAATVMVAIRML